MCSKGVSSIIIFDEETIDRSTDHARCIREVLPVALKSGNNILGIYWTFQQDAAMPDVYHLTQQWCSAKTTFHHSSTRIIGLQTVQISILTTTQSWINLLMLLIGIRSHRKIPSSSSGWKDSSTSCL